MKKKGEKNKPDKSLNVGIIRGKIAYCISYYP